MNRVSLRFEEMPERHAELAWRFGEPDEAATGTNAGGSGDFLELTSPLPPEVGLGEHLEWISGQLHPHEAFVRELITLGGRVVLRLQAKGSTPSFRADFNARLLLPVAHAGVQIEFLFQTDASNPG